MVSLFEDNNMADLAKNCRGARSTIDPCLATAR
jgi:hypothetical protein